MCDQFIRRAAEEPQDLQRGLFHFGVLLPLRKDQVDQRARTGLRGNRQHIPLHQGHGGLLRHQELRHLHRGIPEPEKKSVPRDTQFFYQEHHKTMITTFISIAGRTFEALVGVLSTVGSYRTLYEI